MTEHLPECPLATACKHDYYNEPPIQCANCGESCICDRLRACEERMEESMDRAWAKAAVEIEAHARSLALDAAQKSILALHKPAPVIECECGWGYHCPECGSESNRIICQCNQLRACEQRVEESMDRAWAKAAVEIEAHARSLALDAAQKSILALHKPAPVIECECGWGYDCPECGPDSNRIIGYACSQCCNSWPHTAYCDDMHNEDGTPLHHSNGVMWSGPHCPVIAAIDALRKES